MLEDIDALIRDRCVNTRALSFDGSGNRLSIHIRFIKTLARLLPEFEVLHLVFGPGVSLVSGILPAVLVAKFLGKRVVLDCRGPILMGQLPGENLLRQKLWRVCDRVLVLSAYQQQLVNSFGGRAAYLQAGVPLDEIEPRVIKSLQPRIVVASGLEKEHNIICAIRAFALVKQKYPRSEMTIVGTGSQEAVLRQTVERQKIYGITFAGDVSSEQRREIFRNSELYLNCSSIDFLCGVTIEAFAFGLPVLSTPLSGGTEVFRSRENIVLLPYNDHVGMAERIIELVEDPALAERLSIASRRSAEKYSRSRQREGWLRLYRDLLRPIA